jgi:DNA-directed RNA polymerase I, II, and III subunit RPABC1
MPFHDDEVTRLWRVRRTLFKMLQERGYVVSDRFLNETVEEFQHLWEDLGDGAGQGEKRDRLIILVEKEADNAEKLLVFFPSERKKIGVRPIRQYAQLMEDKNIKRAIVIVQHQLTPFARQAVNEASAKIDMEIFHEKELIVNIAQHYLVPKHEVLNEEEKLALLAAYKIKLEQLPRMQTVDPMARHFGLKRGDIVKITRNSETAGSYITYRLTI